MTERPSPHSAAPASQGPPPTIAVQRDAVPPSAAPPLTSFLASNQEVPLGYHPDAAALMGMGVGVATMPPPAISAPHPQPTATSTAPTPGANTATGSTHASGEAALPATSALPEEAPTSAAPAGYVMPRAPPSSVLRYQQLLSGATRGTAPADPEGRAPS